MRERRQYCTFFLNEHLFGVGVETVQEALRWRRSTRVPLAHPAIGGLINIRGQLVTAIDLRKRMNIANQKCEMPMNLVVRTQEGVVGLLVDRICDVVEVDADAFEPPPETVTGLARELVQGVYKLDERLMLVLDAERAVDLEETVAAATA